MMPNMSYEDAPATAMLATHCAVCGRPLVDAASVEAGIGPDCRRKHGYGEQIAPEARAEANRLVHGIAVERHARTPDAAKIVKAIADVHALGLVALARVLADRLATVKIDGCDDGRYEVRTPYSEDAAAAFRTVCGRRWDCERKVNTFPADARGSLWAVLKALYAGSIAVGPRGPFVIEARP
jgi:hypothetical protein